MQKILLLVLFISTILFSEVTLKHVGLMPFKGDGISEQQLKVITAKFQDEIFKINKFQLMEQSKMESILKEQGMIETGCTQMACFVEIGKAVGVEQMLMGQVTKVGQVTSITVKIVEVETGRIIKSTVLDTKDKFEKILKKHISGLAHKIAGKASVGKSVYTFDSSKKREPIAVLEISGNGIEKSEAKGLTDRLRSELFNTGSYDVLEREQMNEILQEQGFQQSGMCDEASCLVQVGKLVGVTYMVGGSVTRIGDLFSVSARIIDVRTGKIIRTATADVNGNLEKILKETMQDISRIISGLKVHSRTNTAAWITLGGGALLGGIGGYFTLAGDADWELYDSEGIDVNALSAYKDDATMNYNISKGFYGGVVIAVGVSTYMFLTKKAKLKVQNMAILPRKDGLKFVMRF